MSDPEFEAIRKQRLAQLQSQFKGRSDNEEANEKKKQEDMKNMILSQVLDQSARARLNTLSLGKPEKGKMIEEMIVRMAQRGQFSGKFSEKDLIGLLENVSEQTKRNITVKYDRRRAALDSDDDF